MHRKRNISVFYHTLVSFLYFSSIQKDVLLRKERNCTFYVHTYIVDSSVNSAEIQTGKFYTLSNKLFESQVMWIMHWVQSNANIIYVCIVYIWIEVNVNPKHFSHSIDIHIDISLLMFYEKNRNWFTENMTVYKCTYMKYTKKTLNSVVNIAFNVNITHKQF